MNGPVERQFAVETVDRLGLDIRVASLERTLVDVLDRPDLGGGWEENWRSAGSVEYYDIQTVVDYALLLRNATTTAKVGFFLEQHQASWRRFSHARCLLARTNGQYLSKAPVRPLPENIRESFVNPL